MTKKNQELISNHVLRYRKAIEDIPKRDKLDDFTILHQACHSIWGDTFDEGILLNSPGAHSEMKFAMLALKMTKLIIYKPTQNVSNIISNTAIDTMPWAIPEFLTKPFLVESRSGPLVGDIMSIGGISGHQNKISLIAICTDNKIMVTNIDPEWGACLDTVRDANASCYIDQGMDIEERSKYIDDNTKNIMRYLLGLSILLEAENRPVDLVDEEVVVKSHRANCQVSRNSGRRDKYTRRSITVSESYLQKRKHYENSLNGKPLNKDGLVQEIKLVREHYRNQPYGPGNSLRKWIFVSPFARNQWVNNDKPVIVTVK